MTEQAGTKQKTKANPANSAAGSGASSATDSATDSAKGAVKRSAKGPATSQGTASVDAAPAAGATPAAPAFETRHAVLRYTTLRLALFLVALVVVWLVALVFHMDLSSQLSKLTLLAVALLLSSAASFIVLSKQRDAMSAGIVSRTQRLSRKFDDAASFEDDDE
jgi:hypothetical protein